jgi:hypothetical protein
MSYHEYKLSKDILLGHCEVDPPFYALIMAAMRKADDRNLRELKKSFPGCWKELQARYTAPGGWLSAKEAARLSGLDEEDLTEVDFPMEGWPEDEYP